MPDPLSNLSDAELVARTLAGHDPAFRALVERYQGLVYSCAKAITRRDADAADAAQECFIRLHRNLAQYDPRRPLKPYLLTIVANCSRTLLSRRARWVEPATHDEPFAEVADPAAPPAESIVRGERSLAIHAMIDALPQTLREVCALFYFGGCSCREVGDMLAMSETAVKVALHRARKRLLSQGIGDWKAI